MRARLLMLMLVPASLALLTGCAGSMGNKTVLNPELTRKLCEGWRVVRPISSDRLTDRTAETILGNNEARQAWGCHKTRDEAA
jgi:hypothetical protein